jgi:hypothetical protein
LDSETQILSTFAFAFSVTIPIFAIVLLGVILKYIEAINDEFIRVASNLVFNIGLPVMLFISSVKTDFNQLINVRLIVILVAMTMMVYVMSGVAAYWHVQQRRERGIYVQGAFRGNLVIVGLAFCANAYGEAGLAIAALPTAIIIILYNVLSVYVLNITLNQHSNNLVNTLIGIVKNPLIIGIVAGLMVNLSGLPVPDLVLDTGSYLSSMTLPLALLCIGGTLSLISLRESKNAAVASTGWKLVASPVIVCLIAIPLGIRNEELAVLFLLAASPTAAASFIMVKAMGGNSGLAANIVLLTTAGSVVTVTGGLLILKFSGLI